MPWAVLHGGEAPAKGGGCQGGGRHPRGPSWVLPDAESDVNEFILSWTPLGGARDALSERREPHLGPPRAGAPSRLRSRAPRTRRPEVLLARPCPSPQGDQTGLRDPCFCSGPSLWAAGRAGRPRGCSMIPDLLPAPHSRWSNLGSWGSGRAAGEQLGVWAGDGRFSSASPVTVSKPGHRGRGNAPEEAGLELGAVGGGRSCPETQPSQVHSVFSRAPACSKSPGGLRALMCGR